MIIPETIKSMGFDNWAFNVVVNEIENGNIYDGFRDISDDYSFIVNFVGDKRVIHIRVYIPDMGWRDTEIIL